MEPAPSTYIRRGRAPQRGIRKKQSLGIDTTRGEPVYDDSLMTIMRSSLKQHVGLLPDDVSRGPKLSKSSSCVASLDSAKPLSSYYINALASRLSPHTKDICRDNSTTVGAHRGAYARCVEFLEGSLSGIEKLAIDR